MNQTDKKEIVKMMGEVLEQNVLPVLDEVKADIFNTKKELKEDLDDLFALGDRTNRELTKAIDRYDYKLDDHEKRLGVLEGKRV
ncbi:MAG: hypothetical protein A3F35_01270 [Candidatus Woykebacteria bacterium RIFCSPHIGHO2_12_FULL_45_10]|uniref:Uncharacterized protein n=1 Tax=Candidatus Woykebacteria bacterium RIFCSPHIGHO2_12_FULL_45_10 TaxID=1802603 RepID=A0A1G1WSW6_9BACT|nr:MAG: hypothetical protein A3F35_01270 [Candidatus Woykebacteria bacterium RIFCSPHIGHO2_12_FULL_45_10]